MAQEYSSSIMAIRHKRAESYSTLLREIARAGPIARIGLSERTGISRATVTTLIGDLIEAGLVTEVAQTTEASGARGRPRIDLKIAGDAHLVAGIKVADTSISFVLVDFDGCERAAIKQPLEQVIHTSDALIGHITQGIEALAQTANCDVGHISGVGVGLAGLMQAEAGLVHWSPSLDRRNVPFRDDLEAALDTPVFLDNDVNLVAEAELRFGMGRNRKDFIVVTIEAGVGMALVLGGQVYRGARGSGGEFGHTKVQLDGAECRCGQRGCLEAYVADFALHRNASAAGLVDLTASKDDAIQRLLGAAQAGDHRAQNILDDAGRMFALGLANLVNIFDPEFIIIAGAQMQFDHLLADSVIAEMRKSTVQIDKPAPEVVIHKWGDRMWALGAAAHALDYVQDLAVQRLTD